MAYGEPNQVYIPNIEPRWVGNRGRMCYVKLPWDIPNNKWAVLHCFSDDIVSGTHPAVVDVSSEGTWAVELYVDATYDLYRDHEIYQMNGMNIARQVLSEEELKRQGFVVDGGGEGGQGSAAAAVVLEYEPEEEESSKEEQEQLDSYLEQVRKWQRMLEESEPDSEPDDEPELDDEPEICF